MRKRFVRFVIVCLCGLFAACSDDSGQPLFGDDISNAQGKSAGGIWVGISEKNESASFYIAENGTFRSITRIPTVTEGASFGAGEIAVGNGDQVSGFYQAIGIMPRIDAPRPVELACVVNGQVQQHEKLEITTRCSDDSGEIWVDSMLLRPWGYCATQTPPTGLYPLPPGAAGVTIALNSDVFGAISVFGSCGERQNLYNNPSSLAHIAGSYALSFRPDTNLLTIYEDGVLFGNYLNGANCAVNGLVSIIDPRYNLYAVEWTFSDCLRPFPQFEGARFSGLAYLRTGQYEAPDSLYMLMTGWVNDEFDSLSNIFDRL